MKKLLLMLCVLSALQSARASQRGPEESLFEWNEREEKKRKEDFKIATQIYNLGEKEKPRGSSLSDYIEDNYSDLLRRVTQKPKK